jgi:hypothetical protein
MMSANINTPKNLLLFLELKKISGHSLERLRSSVALYLEYQNSLFPEMAWANF